MDLAVDGAAVATLDRGDGPGAPLLCVHGFTGSKEDFAPVLDALAAARRVVAVDLPGHGGTPGHDDPAAYSLETVAGWVLRAADALGLGECHLLGHSLGGLIAQRAAAVASQRLRSLILADTGLGAQRQERADHKIRIAVAARDAGLAAALTVAQEPLGTASPHSIDEDPERQAFERDRFLTLNPAAVIGEVRALLAAAPLGAFLRGIDIPVLVLHGEDDQSWNAVEQALLVRSVAGAEHAVIAAAAHCPQLENPKAWVATVADFLARADDIGARPPSAT